jgi:AcrR family transcriptional regulator
MAEEALHSSLRWRRRKEARPAEILGAALACFAERGFAATRLDDVALRAGITKGTLYLYFDNKDELFKAVVRQELLPNIERLEIVVTQSSEPAAALLELLIRSWAAIIATPISAIPKIMVAEAGNFPELARFYADEIVARGMSLFRRVIEAGVERGEFRPVDVENAVRCIVAPLIMAMLWRYSFGRHEPSDFAPDPLCHTHLQLLLGGLVNPERAATAPITSPAISGGRRDREHAAS